MRVTVIQTAIALTFCGMAVAHHNYAQGLLDKKVSVQYDGATLKQVLTDLEQRTPARFVYNANLLNVQDSITINANEQPLGALLAELLASRNITFEEQGNYILLTRSEPKAQVTTNTSSTGVPWGIIVSGTVTSKQGEALPGVNVLIKGTLIGTTTNAQGRYSIAASPGDILVFSFIGYQKQEVPVNSQTLLDVMLEDDVSTLGEIVVNAGYYTVTDKEHTGNISRVTAAEIERQPVANPLQALMGRMPGVNIQQTSGVPGGAISIQIRGRNSIRGSGNQPFYIIDGVPFTSTSIANNGNIGSVIIGGNPLNSISPNDIESIEILKDANATAIYGSRGANGVVLITTKKGKAGKGKFDVNIYQGAGKVTSMMNMLNTQQYIEMRKEAFVNDNVTPTTANARDLLLWDTTRYTNWQKKFIGGTAQTTNARLSFSGGNAQTQFMMGGEYYRETTVFPGDFAFQRGAGNMSINHQSANGKFKVSFSSNYTSSTNNLLYEDFTMLALSLSPNAPALYTETGSLNWENATWQNPLAQLSNKYKGNTTNLLANVSVDYEVIQGLHLKATIGYNDMRMKEVATHPLAAYNPEFVQFYTARADFSNSGIQTWSIEPQADYRKEIGKGVLNVLVGTTFQESIQESVSYRGTGFTSDALLENINAATTVSINSADYWQYRYAGLFGRINYIYKEKYIVNLTGRRDGSSRFGPGKQFATFAAVGAAWIFSHESFTKDGFPFLSFGKLRTSFGTTGSDQIGNYQFLDLYTPTTYSYNGIAGLIPIRLANPDYAWEINKKYEAGLELGFLHDRILLGTSWYHNTSSNQLVGYSLPVITGFPSVQYNLPATVSNTGLEVELTTINISREKFSWTTSLNLTIPRNKLVSFPNIEAYPTYANRYEVGKPLSIDKVFSYTGVNLLTGVYTFRDENGDGEISAPQDTRAVNIAQDFFGGFNNSLEYKGLRLDIFFQFVKQTGRGYTWSYISTPGIQANQPQHVMERWQRPGDVTQVEKFTRAASSTLTYRISDGSIEDASFIRLKNVALSYQLPVKLIEKAKMQSARIYVQGQNILTFTNYLGLDPENQNTQRLPPLRMATIGIQLTF